MEKRGVVDADNTPPEPETKKCCGKCKPTDLAEHLTKRAADTATTAINEKQ